MRGHGKLEWVGGTRDDAAGEAFDKTARLLGLPYPGGPSISAAAVQYMKNKASGTASPTRRSLQPTTYQLQPNLNLFPRPLMDSDTLDWSFSGLKTAVAREVKGERREVKEVQKLAAEVQEAIVDVLVDKTLKAVEKYKPKSLLVSGGVAANERLKEKFVHEIDLRNLKVKLHVPVAGLCTDNAAAIAACAYYNQKTLAWKKVTANPELTITSHQTKGF
jgi:N6-L-threonylcarbamoyladenine synthase